MYSEARKLHLIEEMLRIKNEAILVEIESILKKNSEIFSPARPKLSDKYKGVFSKEDAKSFDKHTQVMRGEWNNI